MHVLRFILNEVMVCFKEAHKAHQLQCTYETLGEGKEGAYGASIDKLKGLLNYG